MSLTPQFLDEVRARTTLSALIGRSIKIEKAGREYKACCPFHNEKTPSFTISDEKEFFHCHGCHAHGDAIDWLTRHGGLTFIEAVTELAAGAGLSMPQRSAEAARKAEWINGLRPVLDAAQALYAGKLSEPSGDAVAVRAYLADRGVDDALIAAFGIGFAPKDGCLKGQNFGIKSAIAVGLLGQAEAKPDQRHGATYERFRSRIMIPIHDGRGQIIGFGGRIFGEAHANAGKYVNSPGSEIFDKGRTLYNLHRARPAVQAARRVLAVEGYMDVIALAAVGIGEAVAPMGTALTEQQLDALWRMSHRPILLFDGDSAGQKAALRACETALPQIGPGHELALAILPAGFDPDDCCRKAAGPPTPEGMSAGRGAVEAVLASAKSLSEFVFDAVVTAQAGDQPEAVAAVWERLDSLARGIVHEETRAQYLALWRMRFEREVSLTVRHGQGFTVDPAQPLQSGRLVQLPDGEGGYWVPDEANESEKRLYQIIQYLIARRRARDEINQDIRDALAMAKAAGFSTKAINATIRDIEADPEKREEHEMHWSLYRRTLGVSGPMNEATLPSYIDARAHLGAAAAKGKAMTDYRLALLEAGDV